MKAVLIFLVALLAFYCVIGGLIILNKIVISDSSIRLAVYCALCGGIGGITYCLRGVYFNICVLKNWDNTWLPWYFIRPLVSTICGAVSCLFLKAGLILLEAQQPGAPTNLAFYALAFIAGLNVDKFVEKIEDIAQVTWGIKKSRIAQKDDNNAGS